MDEAVNEHKENQEKLELLFWASARGLLADAKELVSQGADPACKDKQGRTPAHYAAAHGHVAVLEYLATRGVDLDVEDGQGRGPLHYASLGDHPDAVTFLCSKGVWVDAPDGGDDTPLHLAARGLPPNVDDTAATLTPSPASSTTNQGGKSTGQDVHVKRRDAAAALRALLKAGAKLEVRNARSLTPLGEAVVSNHVGAVLALLEARAMATVTVKGYSLLHLAAALGHVDCLERLLVEGRRPPTDDTDNPEGVAALHAALQQGQWACAKLLLERGADVAVEDAKGQLPYSFLEKAAIGTTDQGAADSALLPALRKRLQKAAGGRAKAPASKVQGMAGDAASSASGAEDVKAELPVPLGPRDVFRLSDRKGQVRKAMLYASMSDSELRQLPFPSPEALPAIQALRKAHGLHTCWEAVAAIRQDAAFQEDASDRHMQQAVEDLKKPHADTSKYANDRQVQGVFNKMNKLHAILRQQGQGFKVTLDDLIAKPSGPSSVSETLRQLEVLTLRLKEAQDAAVAAIAGEPLAHAGSKAAVAGEKKNRKAKAVAEADGSFDSSTLLDTPLETVEEGQEGPRSWGEWFADSLQFFFWHALRGVFATCLMIMVMWIMGLLPDQVRERTESMQQGLQDTLRAQDLSSVDGGVMGGGDVVGSLLDGLFEGEVAAGGVGDVVSGAVADHVKVEL